MERNVDTFVRRVLPIAHERFFESDAFREAMESHVRETLNDQVWTLTANNVNAAIETRLQTIGRQVPYMFRQEVSDLANREAFLRQMYAAQSNPGSASDGPFMAAAGATVPPSPPGESEVGSRRENRNCKDNQDRERRYGSPTSHRTVRSERSHDDLRNRRRLQSNSSSSPRGRYRSPPDQRRDDRNYKMDDVVRPRRDDREENRRAHHDEGYDDDRGRRLARDDSRTERRKER